MSKFLQSWPKTGQWRFCLKSYVFQNSPKHFQIFGQFLQEFFLPGPFKNSPKHFQIFGQLLQEIFYQDLSKIALSCHTSFDPSFLCKINLPSPNFRKMYFFAKQFIHFINGTQKIQKTNHYILLTNVSRPGSEPGSSGGGSVPTRQVPYRQKLVLSKSWV